ncbi:OmpA family protein [Fulvivirga sp. M361]|uniref:OmpA family protein n=1 Tax=Fulvivirga sp. M361 TaxID=2594266 RepID=UPI001624EB4A|nr:OmpA family protein [Fulvivirga sp. M361]
MMTHKKISISLIVLFFAFSGFNSAHLINKPDNDPFLTTGYYVVIGAYAKTKEYYAKRYADQIRQKGYEAHYGFSQKRNYFFVYLFYTENYRASINKMREVRGINEFDEAWVYVSLDVPEEIPAPSVDEPDKEIVSTSESVTSEKVVIAEEVAIEKSVEESKTKEEQVSTEMLPMKEGNSPGETAQNEVTPAEVEGAIEDFKLTTLADATVFFNLYNAQTKNDVTGEIQVIDAERSKLIKVVPGGDYIKLSDPKNGTGKLTLICDVFGYRKVQKDINYYDPSLHMDEEDIDILADIYVVNFELPRYHAGDVVTMYNVYFYKDAALMRPESKYEIGNLQAMLDENEDYRIRIHGHVNGRHPGKIISRGESSNFFALDESNREGFGSAKELSRQRAEIIRDYLDDQGIEASRMEIKAWGGKRMLHDKHSASAKRNVRVEIEILEE